MSSYTSGGEYPLPRRIHADRAGQTLIVAWPDGHESRYGFRELRMLCQKMVDLAPTPCGPAWG